MRDLLDTLCSSLLVALIRGRGHMIPNSVRCEAHHSIYMNCAHEQKCIGASIGTVGF